jgi:transposase
MQGREVSIEAKMAIILEGLKGVRSISEICREHQISQAQYYLWRDKFLAGAQQGLSSRKVSNEVAQLHQELARLQRLIGKQTIHIEQLKKTENLLGEE